MLHISGTIDTRFKAFPYGKKETWLQDQAAYVKPESNFMGSQSQFFSSHSSPTMHLWYFLAFSALQQTFEIIPIPYNFD